MTTTDVGYGLSDDLIQAFHRDGYVVLRNVISESELAQIEPIFMSFIRGEVPGMGRDFCDMSGSYDRAVEDFSLVNAVLPRHYRPELAGNVFERRALAIARQLIGPTATLDYDQFLAKKPGKSDAVFAWHQDLGYWPTGTPDTITATCSLALDDADAETGCLRVVPGSHKEPALRPHRPIHGGGDGPGARDASHALGVTLNESDRIVELPVKRGDVTIHNERIIHGSGGNHSRTRWRRTYVVAFRTKACVDYERSIGFTHSHNDRIHWETHLGALDTQTGSNPIR